jgi:outer membrane receptor protein involved in Fe transport
MKPTPSKGESKEGWLMHRSFVHPWTLLGAGTLSALLLLGSGYAAIPDDPFDDPEDEVLLVETTQEPIQPVQPIQPIQPIQPLTPIAGPGGDLPVSLGGIGGVDRSLLSADRQAEATQTSASVVSGSDAKTRTATDAGSLLGKSLSTAGVEIQRRSPVANEPRIRGQHVGQVVTSADGAYWFPARQDLDTMLSKIDSGIIRDIIILKGPYSARYGPGFSFIDIETSGTPRFQDGYETHGRSTVNYQTNGEQLYGRQSIWGGSSDYGFRLGYGHRIGNDYEDGDGVNMPSSYKIRDVDSAIGVDLSDCSHIEFGYLRLDQTDTEFPGQVFDISYLVTDGYNLRYTLEDQSCFDKLIVDSWYNRTRFEGDAQRAGKRRQIPQLNSPNNRINPGILNFTGFTDSDEMSSGFSVAATWGEVDCPQLTFGVDMRYIELELNEFDVFDPPTGTGAISNFPIPRSHSSNPGIFLEGVLPMSDKLTVKAGSRVDWVETNIEGTTDGRTRGEMLTILDAQSFDQDFNPWMAYLTAEWQVDCNWIFSTGAGSAGRPPTLTELYAVDPFLAILQQGFTQVRGSPDLHAERLWQFDAGLRWDYSNFRGGIAGFYAWIHDYITYEARDDTLNNAGIDGGLGVNFVNTDLATLAGGEIYGELDCNEWLTPFGRLSYVEGRDRARDERGIIPGSEHEPLPGIAPLESRVGLRIHQPCKEPRWAVEFAARIVDDQSRVATSLLEKESPGFTTYDLRAYWKATDNLLLMAGVENFTDKYYHEHLDLRTGNGVFQPGINGYVGVELNY